MTTKMELQILFLRLGYYDRVLVDSVMSKELMQAVIYVRQLMVLAYDIMYI